DERRIATVRGARAAAWAAVAIVPFFAYLDTVMFAPPVARFLIWRLATIGTALAVIALLRTSLGRRAPLPFGTAIPIVIGTNINLITVIAGRESNPYFSGHMVLLLGASLLFPWTAAPALGLSAFLVGTYAAALLLTGPIANVPVFTTNLFVL